MYPYQPQPPPPRQRSNGWIIMLAVVGIGLFIICGGFVAVVIATSH